MKLCFGVFRRPLGRYSMDVCSYFQPCCFWFYPYNCLDQTRSCRHPSWSNDSMSIIVSDNNKRSIRILLRASKHIISTSMTLLIPCRRDSIYNGPQVAMALIQLHTDLPYASKFSNHTRNISYSWQSYHNMQILTVPLAF